MKFDLSIFKDQLSVKRYHLIFWVIYFVFWMTLTGEWTWDGTIVNFLYIMITGFPAYLNLYFLMPRYLYNQKYFSYTLLFIVNILFNSGLLACMLYGYFYLRSIDTEEFFDFPYILGPTLGAVSTTVILIMIIKLISNLLESEKRNRNLEHEKIQDELKFLKAQLNPHFLFNALNNIYFLIKKDQDKAADSLAKFSDMMRYQLYECNEEKIPLDQELTYLTNYMEIVSLGKDVTKVKTHIDVSSYGEVITPLILLPFVENSFKHVADNLNGENFISISISKSEGELCCLAKNSIGNESNAHDKHEGIGLKNVERRLSLLYPKKYTLELEKTSLYFSAKLKLSL